MEKSYQSEKQRLRLVLKDRRARYTLQERTNASETICAMVRAQAWWRESQTVHIYCAFGTEVQTERLIQSAFAEQKQVIVPLVSETSNLLEHYEITSQTRFETDAFGIPSPIHDSTVAAITATELHCDCVIVPLLGFDAALHRIGYGKGYYDRFLHVLLSEVRTKPHFVGLAFQCQFVEERIYAEAHDIPLDVVITEHDVYELS